MNDGDALYQGILENPDDDEPRLVFADWLQENGDEHFAEFIRVQCRLATLSPNVPEYFELTQRERELEECFESQWRARLPADPMDLGWSDLNERGFPARIGFFECDEEDFEASLTGLAPMLNETPIRGLDVGLSDWEQLERLLTLPKHGPIRDLEITSPRADAWLPSLTRSPYAPELRRLAFDVEEVSDEDFALLAEPEGFVGLERLELSSFIRESAWLHYVFALRGRKLRLLHLNGPDDEVLGLLADSGPYPHLHTLWLHSGDFSAASLERLANPELFPSLAELHLCHSDVGAEGGASLARFPAGRFKRLIMSSCWIENEGLTAMIDAGVLHGVHELNLHSNGIDSDGLTALAESGCLSEVRRLDIDVNPFDNAGLAALGACPDLGNLIHLDVSARNRRDGKLSYAGLRSFLKNLQAPRLRELRLNHLPLGVLGIRSLIESEYAPELRFLHLRHAGLGDNGTAELLNSERLANLMWVDLKGNSIKIGANVLMEPRRLPNLAHCNLTENVIAPEVAVKLGARAGITCD